MSSRLQKSGVVEEVKGRAKAAVADLVDDDDLKKEGDAQQDKARAQRDAAKHEAIAEHRRTAETATEGRERAAQDRGA